jgi:glycosyltransferase involved in cell wall biosynthesis
LKTHPEAEDRDARTSTIGSLVHLVPLAAACGTENYCMEVAGELRHRHGIRNHLALVGDGIHPEFRDALARDFESLWRRKYWRGLRVPKAFASLRARERERFLHNAEADAHLVWNTGAASKILEELELDPSKTLYFERGMAWEDTDGDRAQRFFERVGAILCNSHAGRRMLELRFGVKQTPVVVRNGLQPRAAPDTPRGREAVVGRPFRIGVAARLVPLKGVSLAIHALALLHERGRPVEMHIAGEGSEAARLRSLVGDLGSSGRVHLRGHVSDMRRFFADTDVLLHPALREPSSNAVVEAAAHGCPVVAARVDGMPEVVQHGETGILVDPSLESRRYTDFGGSPSRLPALVYDPVRDTLREPRICAPEALADAVDTLITDQDRYVHMSAAAADRVAREFDFASRTRDLVTEIERFIRG